MQKSLVLSVLGSSEPLIYSIKRYKAEFLYFIHSKDTREHVDITLKEFDYGSSQYLLKELKNPQSLEESFSKSREIISSLKKDYDVNVDFTGGTKPMVAGLVLAAIGEECKYSYVGSTKGREGRDKDGVGVVVSGFEEIISQKDPYDLYAVVEFNRGMDFFNKYQFTAAKSNFSAASEKLEDENLKELANLYVDLVELYDVWDKFNNLIADKKTLNRYLENQILKKINDSENIRNTLEDEAPGFLSQIEANIEFLKLKISRKGAINLKNVKYYLPDLLNNASRRIEEGKYDDAVARLYRATELIAQTGLAKEGFIELGRLKSWKIFYIDLNAVEQCDNEEVIDYVAATPDAIGIIGANWIGNKADTTRLSFNQRVRVMSVSESSEATPENSYRPYQAYLALKQYPLTNEVYILINDPKGALPTGLMTFLTGERGQRIILKSGLIPATQPVRIVNVKDDF